MLRIVWPRKECSATWSARELSQVPILLHHEMRSPRVRKSPKSKRGYPPKIQPHDSKTCLDRGVLFTIVSVCTVGVSNLSSSLLYLLICLLKHHSPQINQSSSNAQLKPVVELRLCHHIQYLLRFQPSHWPQTYRSKDAFSFRTSCLDFRIA